MSRGGPKKGREGRDNCLAVIDRSCGFLVYFARRARRACDQSAAVIKDRGFGGLGWGGGCQSQSRVSSLEGGKVGNLV